MNHTDLNLTVSSQGISPDHKYITTLRFDLLPAMFVILAPLVTVYGYMGIFWSALFSGAGLLLLELKRLIHNIKYFFVSILCALFLLFLASYQNEMVQIFFQKIFQMRFDHYFPSYGSTEETFLLKTLCSGTFIGVFCILFLTRFNIKTKLKRVLKLIPLIWAFVFSMHYLKTNYKNFLSHITRFFSEDTSFVTIIPYSPLINIGSYITQWVISFPTTDELRALIFPMIQVTLVAILETYFLKTILYKKIAQARKAKKKDQESTVNESVILFINKFPFGDLFSKFLLKLKFEFQSPLVSLIHALIVLLYILTLYPIFYYIPLTSFAPILLYVIYRISVSKTSKRKKSCPSVSELRLILIASILMTIVSVWSHLSYCELI